MSGRLPDADRKPEEDVSAHRSVPREALRLRDSGFRLVEAVTGGVEDSLAIRNVSIPLCRRRVPIGDCRREADRLSGFERVPELGLPLPGRLGRSPRSSLAEAVLKATLERR